MRAFLQIRRFLIILSLFLLGDALWLGVVSDAFYRERIGHLMGPVNWPAAVVFYLVYVGGIVYFAVAPALSAASSAGKAARIGAVRGGLFGAVAYATYELTNLATLRGWPLDMVVIDICWGMVLTGTVTAIGCYLERRLFQ